VQVVFKGPGDVRLRPGSLQTAKDWWGDWWQGVRTGVEVGQPWAATDLGVGNLGLAFAAFDEVLCRQGVVCRAGVDEGHKAKPPGLARVLVFQDLHCFQTPILGEVHVQGVFAVWCQVGQNSRLDLPWVEVACHTYLVSQGSPRMASFLGLSPESLRSELKVDGLTEDDMLLDGHSSGDDAGDTWASLLPVRRDVPC
jgi:hypothetical protein